VDTVNEMKPLMWRKSTFSASGDNCVEVARMPEGGQVLRDSKIPGGPMLSSPLEEWRRFIAEIKAGGLS
jgi:Domain of unknown function (DUF397)